MTIHITTMPEFHDLIKSEKLTVLDFYTVWCPPCKVISPIFDGWAEKFPEVQFVKTDAERNRGITRDQQITWFPTFKFYKNGELLATVKGEEMAQIRSEVGKLVLEHAGIDITK